VASLLNEEAARLDAARKADEVSGRSGDPVEDVVITSLTCANRSDRAQPR
jgi:hypothetical protein